MTGPAREPRKWKLVYDDYDGWTADYSKPVEPGRNGEQVTVVEKDLHREAVAREIADAMRAEAERCDRKYHAGARDELRIAADWLEIDSGFCSEEGSP